MQKKSGKTAYILWLDSIDQVSTCQVLDKIFYDIESDVSHLYFVISTNGGSVSHGIVLYNILRSLPYDITMHNIGNIDSIGNVVFMAGTHRYATPNATFMLHPVQTTLKSKEANINIMREKCSAVEVDDKRIKEIFLQHTSIPPSQLDQYFCSGEAKDAEYARDIALIDDIRDVEIDQLCQIIIVPAASQNAASSKI